MTRCLRWFVGLLALNLITFWVAVVLFIESPWAGAMFFAGPATVGPLAIYALYKFSRVTGSWRPLIFYSLLVLLPPLATFTLIFLASKALGEAATLGYRITVLPPRLSAGLGYAFAIVLGCYLIYGQAVELRNHAWLRKSGVPISGTLKMVTKHSINFIPSGNTFTISYLGKSKTFDVDSEVYEANMLPGDKFTHHPISLVYLPDRPDVAELPEMLGFHLSSLFPFVMGGILVIVGSWMLRGILNINRPPPKKI